MSANTSGVAEIVPDSPSNPLLTLRELHSRRLPHTNSGRVTPNVDTLDRLLAACGYRMEFVPDVDAPRWTRIEEKSLAVHRSIAARLRPDPASTLKKARGNLAKLREADRGNAAHWLDEWDGLLDRSTDEIVTALLARTQQGIHLRQMTPFAGVLTDTERGKALRSVPGSDAA